MGSFERRSSFMKTSLATSVLTCSIVGPNFTLAQKEFLETLITAQVLAFAKLLLL